MTKAFGAYQRVGRGLLGCSSLWIGDGHLLYIKGTGFLIPFTEEYLRFELKKIQGISIVRTRTGLAISLVVAALVVLTGGLAASATGTAAAAVGDSRFVYWFLAIVFGLSTVAALAVLVVNLALGPTCLCLLQSPVRSERLRPLRRLRVARRVITELAAIIERSQQLGREAPPPMPTLEPPVASMPTSENPHAI
jgi:hypothetical protein